MPEEARIEKLVEKIEALHDPSALHLLQEYLESMLNFYTHGPTHAT